MSFRRRASTVTLALVAALPRVARATPAASPVYDVVSTCSAKGDGTTDDTAHIQTCFNDAVAASPGGSVHIPCGQYYLTGSISVTVASGAALSVHGEGSDCAVLYFYSGSGLVINYGNQFSSVTLEDFSVTTGTASTSTVGVKLALATSVSNPAVSARNSIKNVTLRGGDGYVASDYWGTGISIANVSNVNFYGVFVASNSSNNGNGVALQGLPSSSTYGVSYNFAHCTFQNVNYGIQYLSYVQGVTVNQSNFTFGTYGIYVPASQAGGLDQLAVSNSQFNMAVGVYELTIVEATSLANNLFLIETNGVGASVKSGSVTVTGNSFDGYTGSSNNTGINVTAQFGSVAGNAFWDLGEGVNASSSVCMITGNTFYSDATGVYLTSSSAGNNVQSNLYSGVTTAVSDNGTGNVVGGGSK
jgi:parallel beta-helix repeat protein